MKVRTGICAGVGAELEAQQLEQLVQLAQRYSRPVNQGQLAALTRQLGLQVDPHQLAAVAQMAGGMTGPKQFLSMVSQ